MRKKRIIGLFIICLLAFLLSGCMRKVATGQKYYRFNYQRGMELDVETRTGDIVINKGYGDEIKVEARIKAWAGDIVTATELVNQTEVVASEGSRYLRLRSNYLNDNFHYGSRIDYVITIPAEFDGQIRTDTGDVRIEEARGSTNIEVDIGDVDIDRFYGSLRVADSTGDVDLNRVVGDLTVQINTGDLEISHLEGRDGRVRIDGGTGKVDVTIDHLEWDLKWDPDNKHPNWIESNTGDIDINFGDRVSARVKARSNTGDVEVNGFYYGDYYHYRDLVILNLYESRADLEITSDTGDIDLYRRY